MNLFNHLLKLVQDAQGMTTVQRLGWMLVHSLWQGAVLAILLQVFLVATRWRSGLRWSNIRYAGACAALAMLGVIAATTFVYSGPNTPALAHHSQTPAPAAALSFSGTTSALPAMSTAPALPHRLDWQSFIPWFVLVWIAGVLVLSARYFVAWLRIRQLQQGEPLCHCLWTQSLQPLAERMGIHRVVRLVGSCGVGVPVVIGALKPVIVIPLGIVNCLSPQQVQAILAHELAHIRRHDYFFNLLQTALETIFFYHPAVWWMSAQIRSERENCCDDAATAACGDRLNYAGALVALEQQCGGSHRMALAATDGSLLQRVRRLLAAPSPRRPLARANHAALVGLICLAMLITGEYLVRTHGHVAMAAPPDAAKPQAPATQAQVNKIDPAVQAKLDRTLPEIKIDSNELSEWLEFLRDETDTKIVVNWRALETVGVVKDTPVNIRTKDVKASEALQHFLDAAAGGAGKLGYIVDQGHILISTVDDLRNVQAERKLQVIEDVTAELRRPLPEAKFPGNALSDILDFLNDFSGRKIVVNWPALEAAGVGKDTPVNVKLKDVTGLKALQLILDEVGGGTGKLGYVIDEGVIQISAADDHSKSVAKENGSPATQPGGAVPEAAAGKLHEWVEDFFQHNYRDITDRKTLEWGDPETTPLGNLSIRYKCDAVIWEKEIVTMNKVFTFTPQGEYVSVKDVEGFPVKRGDVPPITRPVIAEDKIDDALHQAVEKFFHENYRDITARKTLEWGKPQKQADGNWQIRYKYQATIWDKDQIINDQIFTFSPTGEYVAVKDAAPSVPVAPAAPSGGAKPEAGAEKLHKWVEDFFQHNYRDITERKTLEWGEPQSTPSGNLSIRYKFDAVIWDKEIMTMNQVFTFTPQGKFVSVKDVEGFPVKRGVVPPTTRPVIADDKIDEALHQKVEKFFRENYRDITARKTIEWGKPQKQSDGNWQIRYKYQATIWDKDQIVSDKIFTFSPTGEYLGVKDAAPSVPATQGANDPAAAKAKETVLAAYKAGLAGDKEGMIGCFDQPSAAQKEALGHVVNVMAAAQDLGAAISDKFGRDQNRKIFDALNMGVIEQDIAKATVTLGDDSAVIDMGNHGPRKVPLVKVGGVWKISPNVLDHAPDFAILDRNLPALKKITADIKAGKYQSAEDVQVAFEQFMAQFTPPR